MTIAYTIVIRSSNGMTHHSPNFTGDRGEGPVPLATNGFEALYQALAKQCRLTLIPFFLEGVAVSSTLNQADGIHPTGEGYRLIVEKVFPTLEPLLERKR